MFFMTDHESLYVYNFHDCIFQAQLEVMWAMKAYNHAEVYFNVSILQHFHFQLDIPNHFIFTFVKTKFLEVHIFFILFHILFIFSSYPHAAAIALNTKLCRSVYSLSHLSIQSFWNSQRQTTRFTQSSEKIFQTSISRFWIQNYWNHQKLKRFVTCNFILISATVITVLIWGLWVWVIFIMRINHELTNYSLKITSNIQNPRPTDQTWVRRSSCSHTYCILLGIEVWLNAKKV